MVRFSLLGSDHLDRGSNRAPGLRSKAVFAALEFAVTAFVFAVLESGRRTRGETRESEGHGRSGNHDAVDHESRLQREVVFLGCCVYSLKVTCWNCFLSHTETISVRSAVLIAAFHLFFFASVAVFSKTKLRRTLLKAVVGSGGEGGQVHSHDFVWPFAFTASSSHVVACGTTFLCALGLETLADLELAIFKKRKMQYAAADVDHALSPTEARPIALDSTSPPPAEATLQNDGGTISSNRVLRTGLHAYSRHPSYFFNCVAIGFYAGLAGSVPFAVLWFLAMVCWAYTQSGPHLENHMARKYGAEWQSYCAEVPFFWPRFFPLGRGSGRQQVTETEDQDAV